MNEIEVELPGGGRAWITKYINHAQHRALTLHQFQLARYIGPTRDAEGQATTGFRTDLTPEEQEAKEILLYDNKELMVRTMVRRWENVTDGDGKLLAFPDDIGLLRQADLESLFAAATVAREPLGNSPAPSEPSSEAAPAS